jgi:hypothetical protein
MMMEDALQRVSHTAEQMDPPTREKIQRFMAALKGEDHTTISTLNEALFYGQRIPSIWDRMVESVSGASRTKAIQEKQLAGEISPREAKRVLSRTVGMTFLSLISPLKLAQLNVTEYGWLLRELAKDPRDLARVDWMAKGLAKGVAEGGKELASFLQHKWDPNKPRYYSEPSTQGVTNWLHDLQELQSPGETDLFRRIMDTWGTVLRFTEFPLRAAAYYTLKERNLKHWPEISDQMNKDLASMYTNYHFAAFGPGDQAPEMRSLMGIMYMIFRRFSFSHGEHAIMGLKGAGELLGRGASATGQALPSATGTPGLLAAGEETAMPGPQQGQLQRLPVPGLQGLPMGDAESAFQEIYPTGGALKPPATPPPSIPRGQYDPYGDWDPEEWDAWVRMNDPAAHYGSSLPAGPNAALRWALLLGLGFPVGGIGMLTLASLQFSGEDYKASLLINLLNPLDFRNLGENPSLFWWKPWYTFNMLNAYKTLFGIDLKQVEQLQEARRQLYFRTIQPLASMSELVPNPSFKVEGEKDYYREMDRRRMLRDLNINLPYEPWPWETESKLYMDELRKAHRGIPGIEDEDIMYNKGLIPIRSFIAWVRKKRKEALASSEVEMEREQERERTREYYRQQLQEDAQ